MTRPGRPRIPRPPRPVLGIRLDATLRSALRAYAARRGESESTVAREILRDRLRAEGVFRVEFQAVVK